MESDMPEQVARFPGSKISSLDWDKIADGNTWFFSHEEIKEDLNAKPDSLRAYAHGWAKENGVKFRTKLNDEGLYLERR
jgi:hypothetical protein